MHRAVVLTTLVLLLLAVAGVSAAQDSGIFDGGPNSEDPPGSTTQERTSLEATVAEDTMKSALPGATSEPKVGEDASEPKVVSEPTVEETEKPTAAAPGEKTLLSGSKDVVKPADSGRGVGKAALVGKAPNIGNPPARSTILPTASPKGVGMTESMGGAAASKRSRSATRTRASQ